MSTKTEQSVEEWLDNLDPATADVRRPAPEILAIRNAAIAVDEAHAHLHQAVTTARAAGISWVRIGMTLGITKQAAQQRFGE